MKKATRSAAVKARELTDDEKIELIPRLVEVHASLQGPWKKEDWLKVIGKHGYEIPSVKRLGKQVGLYGERESSTPVLDLARLDPATLTRITKPTLELEDKYEQAKRDLLDLQVKLLQGYVQLDTALQDALAKRKDKLANKDRI